MTTDQLLVTGLLAGTMVLFVQGRWRHDVVAFGALMAGVVLGAIPAESALVGFGHPAVFTVAAILVISRALQSSGALDRISERIGRLDDQPLRQSLALTALATGFSAFMNNVGALALVMPVAIASCTKSGRSPSLVLMPIAFGAVLGGLLTLIGTPPNLIVSRYREAAVGEPFGMFEFLPIGLPLAVLGLLYFVTLGRRLLPADGRSTEATKVRFEIRDYVTELQVPHGSAAVGRSLAELAGPRERDLEILGLIRSEVALYDSVDNLPLRPGDILILRADSRVFRSLVETGGLEMVGQKDIREEALRSRDVGVLEVIVPPGSRLEGRTPSGLRLHARLGVNVLAVARRGRPPEERLDDVVLKGGDVLLLQGDSARLAEVSQTYGALPLAERGLRTTLPRRRGLPLLLFSLAVVATALEVVPVHIAFGVALIAMVATHSVTIRQLYETIDWSVIVLLAAMIPIGTALETSRTTDLLATAILDTAHGASPSIVVGILLVATSALTNVINNAATAVVMAPIGLSLATQLGCRPDAFLMAVAVGSSCAFATPIGHQNNVLVMGPGGYRFADYFRVGVPLTVLVLAVALPVILTVWPL